jgi:hypothetical protein
MQRTLAALREAGYVPIIVEHFHAPTRQRRDLLGIIDVLALDPVLGLVIGVQVCGSDFAPHVRKIAGSHAAEARLWLACADGLWVYGWRKLKIGGRRVWRPRVRAITLEDLRG